MLSPDTEPSLANERPTATLLAASSATALVLVAFTLPLGLLAPIGADLSATVAGRTWVLSSMSVGLAGCLLIAGTLADDLGRRRVFLWGLALFGLASLTGALAPSVVVLALARGGQGAGGAALLSASLALLAHAFPAGEARTHATGVWGAMIGAGIAAGPLAGAVIARAASWRTAYLLLGLLALVLVVPAARALEESRAAQRRPIDVLGAALLCGGLVALTTGLVQGNESGWDSVGVLCALGSGALLLSGFAIHQRHRTEPMFDLALLRRPAFSAALVGSLVLGLTVLAFMSYSVTFLQTTLGASTVSAALWTLPWSLVSFVVAARARSISRHLTPRAQTALGLTLCAAGLLAMLGLDAQSRPIDLLAGLLVVGLGTGLLNAALARAAVSVVPTERSAMGAGANNTARYLGAALGVALLVAVLQSGTQRRAATRLNAVASLRGEAGHLSRQVADGRAAEALASVPAHARPALGHAALAATAGAMNTVLWLSAGLSLAGAGFCLLLMRPRAITRSQSGAQAP